MTDSVAIGIPAAERRIDQRECKTKACAWNGQRWDALTSHSGELCPECRQAGAKTGVKVYVADGERHLQRHGRIIDEALAGGDVS